MVFALTYRKQRRHELYYSIHSWPCIDLVTVLFSLALATTMGHGSFRCPEIWNFWTVDRQNQVLRGCTYKNTLIFKVLLQYVNFRKSTTIIQRTFEIKRWNILYFLFQFLRLKTNLELGDLDTNINLYVPSWINYWSRMASLDTNIN